MCQYLTYSLSLKEDQHSNQPTTLVGCKILELGCGSGIVGITAALTARDCQRNHPKLIISTDVDDDAIQLCWSNIQRNDLETTSRTSSPIITARKLSWGNDEDISLIIEQVGIFDSIIAADIIYPTTTDETLVLLFKTVEKTLKIGGSFLLSFVSRDGFKTPRRFVQAASSAKFRIESIPYKNFIQSDWTNFLPPLLDAVLLRLTRDENSQVWNGQLGSDTCSIFPRMKEVSQTANGNEHENEEWTVPQCFDDDDNGH
jgi:ribosomal protein L11 methylase PrmA